MKKLLGLLLIGCLPNLVALGQGTVIFANGAAGVNAPVRDAWYPWGTGVLLTGPRFAADLLVGAAGINDPWYLQPCGFVVPFSTGLDAGYFFGGVQTIPGTGAEQTVSLAVGVWDTALGPTFSAARSSWGLAWGYSNPIQVRLGGGIMPPPAMVGLHPFRLWTPIPEPPVAWLTAIGCLSLWLFRPRKQFGS